MSKITPVLIEWIDSMGRSGWSPASEREDIFNLNCTSVGILVKKTKDRVILALSQTSQGGVGETLQIPLVAVKKIRKLKV